MTSPSNFPIVCTILFGSTVSAASISSDSSSACSAPTRSARAAIPLDSVRVLRDLILFAHACDDAVGGTAKSKQDL